MKAQGLACRYAKKLQNAITELFMQEAVTGREQRFILYSRAVDNSINFRKDFSLSPAPWEMYPGNIVQNLRLYPFQHPVQWHHPFL